ncbi:E3 ubiquitin protein ligase DRIP2-like [Typha latifolia]|uniref:E3 ubiquitin protein ligase DRIP2-like n=1 Tax=Typha latifolia TaxID=4733 RepID=UPI003C2EB83E
MVSESLSPPPQVVRVRRELLASCMTCPLCKKLLWEATTISECLHTFCRKCIFEKLTDEEIECCPICKIDLGCIPVEKLRPDHNLQDIRVKIFPLKRRKLNPEIPSIILPVRRKERSLSSLVVSTPRVATQSGLTGRRTKAGRRAAASRGICQAISESTKKEANNFEDQDNLDKNKATSSPETLIKITRNKKQNNYCADSSNQAFNKDMENGRESFLDKAELWKPLNCLVEAANRTKALTSSPQRLIVKEEQINDPDCEINIPKTKVREHLNKSKFQEEKNSNASLPPTTVRAKRLRGVCRGKRELRTSAQALLDTASTLRDRRQNPVWFSLVASANQEEGIQLPQLSANILRIKDGNLPISSIQKYLMTKLDLASEDEVEIVCQGQLMNPTMTLHSLVDLWLRTESTHKIQASVGTSGKDFIMVLTYRHRVAAT